jgi:hypothetical protein
MRKQEKQGCAGMLILRLYVTGPVLPRHWASKKYSYGDWDTIFKYEHST